MKKQKRTASEPKNQAVTLANLVTEHRELDACIEAAEHEYLKRPTQARRDEIRKQKRRKCTLKARIERFKKLCGEGRVPEPAPAPDLPVPDAADAATPINQFEADEPAPIFRSRRAA